MRFRWKKAPPGPRGYPLLGLLHKAWQDPPRFFLDVALRYGEVVRLRMGVHRAYLLSHPEHIKHVLQDNFLNYVKSPPRIEKIKPLFGEGLTTSEGDAWRRQRHLIQPAFHRERIAGFTAVITDATTAMVEHWRTSAAKPLDIAAEMLQLTRGITLKALFSTDLKDEAAAVDRALTIVLEHINRTAWALINLPERLRTPRTRRFQHALTVLDTFVYRMIDERRYTEKGTDDVLAMLLSARDEETGEGMSDRQLRDEVMTMFVAGHQTTSNVLAWTWYLLSKNPEVQRRLQAELVRVLGSRTPTYQDVPQLTYTRMVIEEAMRLYPPTWITARRPVEADTIGGYHIPANAVVLLSPYVTHHHPAFWENPEGFDPDRFTAEQVAERPRYAYFPFGGGPRVCVGRSLALVEAQLIIATVAQQYRLDLVPGYPVEPQAMMTLHPRHGVLMTLHKQPV
ncbi:MAG: cytochrome P450 [Candidatus Methylomirabilales bacterium]